MVTKRRLREHSVILFVVGFLALNYPFLSIFNKAALVLGVPLLYVYLFLVWLLLIIVMAITVERNESLIGERSDIRDD